MTSRPLLTALACAAACAPLAAAAPADARSWATGSYAGTIDTVTKSPALRGSASFTLGTTKLTAKKLTFRVRCTDGDIRTFSMSGMSERVRTGTHGAYVKLKGRETIDGFDVDFSLVGGAKGSRMTGTFSASAYRSTDDGAENCSLVGDFSTRRRG